MTETVRTWTAGACPKGHFFQKSQCENGDTCNTQTCTLPTQKRQTPYILNMYGKHNKNRERGENKQ